MNYGPGSAVTGSSIMINDGYVFDNDSPLSNLIFKGYLFPEQWAEISSHQDMGAHEHGGFP